MGSQGFEPRSWDFSCLSTPIVHHNRYCSVTRIFSSKTTGVPDDARLHYNPNYIYNIKFILMIYKSYDKIKI